MFNSTINKYSNYIIDFNSSRKIHTSTKTVKRMKRMYKQLFINTFVLCKHAINKRYVFKKKKLTKYSINTNFIILKKKQKKTKKILLVNTLSFFKSLYVKQRYTEFNKFFLFVFLKFSLKNFKYYWPSLFLKPSFTSNHYYFTNRIRYFSNQRLIKQPILLVYNIVGKNNLYSNYLKVFKSILMKKNINSLFFFKTVLLQIYPKVNTTTVFFRHINFLKKFTTQSYLKLLLV